MIYNITVRAPITCTAQQLASALQTAYDAGAAGMFKVKMTESGACEVEFERDGADDYEFVLARLAGNPTLDVRRCVQMQLGEELRECDQSGHETVEAIAQALLRGEGHCKDVTAGALDWLGERN